MVKRARSSTLTVYDLPKGVQHSIWGMVFNDNYTNVKTELLHVTHNLRHMYSGKYIDYVIRKCEICKSNWVYVSVLINVSCSAGIYIACDNCICILSDTQK